MGHGLRPPGHGRPRAGRRSSRQSRGRPTRTAHPGRGLGPWLLARLGAAPLVSRLCSFTATDICAASHLHIASPRITPITLLARRRSPVLSCLAPVSRSPSRVVSVCPAGISQPQAWPAGQSYLLHLHAHAHVVPFVAQPIPRLWNGSEPPDIWPPSIAHCHRAAFAFPCSAATSCMCACSSASIVS